jgi:AcrR family transcriptional regulator
MPREPHLKAVADHGNADADKGEDATDPPATDGRVLGRRGQATRRKLLDCTREALSREPYRDVKVVDIARQAGTSPATFYQYFPDVEHAVLVLSEEIALETDRLVDLVAGDWQGAAGSDTARGLVRGFLDHWEKHRPVLRVVELATEQGDLRFQRLRVRALNNVTRALADVIAGFQRSGDVPTDVDAMATAGSLVAMLAHTAAHRYGFEFWGIRTADVETALTRIVHWTVTGQKP